MRTTRILNPKIPNISTVSDEKKKKNIRLLKEDEEKLASLALLDVINLFLDRQSVIDKFRKRIKRKHVDHDYN